MSRASDLEGLEKECAKAYTERVKDINRIARDTKTFIRSSKKEREDMADALHKNINADEAARKRKAKADRDARVATDKKLKADATKLVKQLSADNTELKADTQKMVSKFQAETKAAGRAWGNLVKTMAEKRGAKVAKKPAAPKAKTPAAPKAKVPAVTGDAAKVMSLVKANAAGIKLTEIEKKTGLARIKAARVLRGLMDDGKITKEELLYKPL